MKKTIVIQVVIFIAAFFSMTPDIAEDNSYLFGLIGDVTIVRGNTIWVMLAAMVLSIINIWFWWPKQVKVINTSETAKESEPAGMRITEPSPAKVDDGDPKTPDLS